MEMRWRLPGALGCAGVRTVLVVRLVLFCLAVVAVTRSSAEVLPIHPDMPEQLIMAWIKNATSEAFLQIQLGPGRPYTQAQVTAILATRVENVSIELQNETVFFDCNVRNDSAPMPIIEVANAQNYSMSGAQEMESGGLTLLACAIIFRNPTGRLLLEHLVVMESTYSNESGIVAALAVVSDSVTGACNLVVRNSKFQNNTVTPLMIDGSFGCVSVEGCEFLYNSNHVESAAIAAFNRSTLAPMLSAGIALGVTGVGQRACLAGQPLVRLWNNMFLLDHVLVNLTANPDLPQDDALTVADTLNGGLSSCGAGVYMYLAGDGTATGGVQVGGAGTLFQHNRNIDTQRTVAAGGGMCVHFRRNSSAWQVAVDDVRFEQNLAERTGALHVLFDEAAHGSRVKCRGLLFSKNVANPHDVYAFHESRGGAVSLEMGRQTMGNTVWFWDSQFIHNQAAEGGAVHTYYHSAERDNQIFFSGCTFEKNRGVSGAAMFILSSHQQGSSSSAVDGKVHVEIFKDCTILTDCNFTDNVAFASGTVSVSFSHLVLNGLVTFRGNQNSALSLVNTFAYFNESATVEFLENVGGLGAGLFSSDSETILYSGTTVKFLGNIAQTTGGAVQANMHTRSVGLVGTELRPHCFLLYYAVGTPLKEWNISVEFRNNKAGQAGAGIYAPDFTPCLFLGAFDKDSISFRPIDYKKFWDQFFFKGDHGNILNRTLSRGSPYVGARGATSYGIPRIEFSWSDRWLPNPNLTNTTENMTGIDNTMSTDIITLDWKPCDACGDLQSVNDNGSTLVRCAVSPGENFHFSAKALDQFDQTRDALLLVSAAVDLDTTDGEDGPNSTYVTLDEATGWSGSLSFAGVKGIPVNFSVSVVGTTRLVVDTMIIDFTHCPHGFHYPTKSTNPGPKECRCESIRHPTSVLLCEQNRYVYLYEGTWAGDSRPSHCYDSLSGPNCSSFKKAELKYAICPPGYCKLPPRDPKLSLLIFYDYSKYCNVSEDGVGCLYDAEDQNSLCAHGREGRLCGQCPQGKTRALLAEEGSCTNCTDVDHKKLIAFFVGIPVLFVIILLLNIPLSNDLRGLLFAAATMRTLICPEDRALLDQQIRDWFGVLLGIGEVALPGGGCYIPDLQALEAISLGYSLPVAALLITLILHILSRKVKWMDRWVARNDQNTLWQGTWLLIFICFQKILQTSIKFLVCIEIFDKNYFFYDGTVECFVDREHIACVAVAFVCMALLVVLMYLAYRLSTEKPVWCVKDAMFHGSVLRRGLKQKFRWWPVWDLGRRAIVYLGGLLVTKGCESRQVYMLCVVVFIFAAHMLAYPYETIQQNDTRAQLVTYATPRFLRSGTACNRLEATVLFSMCILAGFSMNYRHVGASEGVEDGLEYVLVLLASWPVIAFTLLFLYKLFTLVMYRFGCTCCDPWIKPAHANPGPVAVNAVEYDTVDGPRTPDKPLRPEILQPLIENDMHFMGSYSSTNEASI